MVRGHAEALQGELVTLLGQHAKHDRFAERAGHGGDPDVHLPSGHPGRDPPVLRQPALRDVDAGDELDARGHRGEAFHGLRELRVQHAVDAHPHRELRFARLHMDVGRAEIHRLREQVVHELDDGRLLRHLPQVPGAVARVQALDRLLLLHEVQQTIDLVVGGEAEGHGLPGEEVVERLEEGVVLDVPGETAQLLAPAPHEHRVVDEPLQPDGRLAR